MNLIGLDLSLSASGAVVLDNTTASIVVQKTLSAPNGITGVERLFFIQNEINTILDTISIDYACLESPAFGSRDGQLFSLGEITAVFKLALFKRSIPFILVAPTQLKKYVSGLGKGGKQLVILDTYKKYGIEFRDDNQCDAYILARIVRDYYYVSQEHKMPTDAPKYQIEVLKKLQESFPNSFLL